MLTNAAGLGPFGLRFLFGGIRALCALFTVQVFKITGEEERKKEKKSHTPRPGRGGDSLSHISL